MPMGPYCRSGGDEEERWEEVEEDANTQRLYWQFYRQVI